MSTLIKQFILVGVLLHAAVTHAQQPEVPSSAEGNMVLEKTSITIRMMGATPYAELRLCEECPLRLLPFAANAQIHLDGQQQTSQMLNEGQTLMGAVFIQSQPVDSISAIVAH